MTSGAFLKVNQYINMSKKDEILFILIGNCNFMEVEIFMEKSEIVFRVAKETDTKKLASAIFSNLKNTDTLTLSCLGVPAVNQAIKSIITARSSSISNGFDIASYPHFSEVTIEGEEKTSISIVLKKEMV